MILRRQPYFSTVLTILILLSVTAVSAQVSNTNSNSSKIRKATKKVEIGYRGGKTDTLAQGYYELGESYFQKGDLPRSESYFQKAKESFERIPDADGAARSSRALAKVQESLDKKQEAVSNYKEALKSDQDKNGTFSQLNSNDIQRLSGTDSAYDQETLIEKNIKIGLVNRDTSEIVSSFTRMGDLGLKTNKTDKALEGFTNAYWYSRSVPEQALKFNQKIADVYLQSNNLPKAIETKRGLLKEDFVKNSTELTAREKTSLAELYLLNHEDSTALQLLNESYGLSIDNGHTLAARSALEKLDSIYLSRGKMEKSLQLYQGFLARLPQMLARDSSIADNRLVAETESRIRELENEKALKDDLIKRKSMFNYWLTGSLVLMAGFAAVILFVLKKLRVKNKKIALQSLRREMNPHFIFNSLNSVNQFIAQHNELEANRYLTRFSTLMRRVMENSTHDFVLFSKEYELLYNYLELEKTRFQDAFDFKINVNDHWLHDEQLFIPGMLVQPHLENAIWHGLRYGDNRGLLELSFTRTATGMDIMVEDNGIGIAKSELHKTENQKKRSGRGIRNTMERINILNELYGQRITCSVEDKPYPESGVRVRISVPVMKNNLA
ncbi:MAG: histidine kinase [Ferruginibacter sp.]